MTIVLAALIAACVASVPPASPDHKQCCEQERVLEKEVVVNAAVGDVWHAWSTEEGLRFISNRSRVELRVGGPYEWFLDGPVESDGRRGAEGSRVLAFLPQEMIAFEWTFPPSLPTLRKSGARTQVVVLLDELEPRRTRVRLHVLGWQAGADWDQGYEYFDGAWSYVLTALKEKLEAAPAGQAADAPWDVVLMTEWPDSTTYANREALFRPLLDAQGKTLIDGLSGRGPDNPLKTTVLGTTARSPIAQAAVSVASRPMVPDHTVAPGAQSSMAPLRRGPRRAPAREVRGARLCPPALSARVGA